MRLIKALAVSLLLALALTTFVSFTAFSQTQSKPQIIQVDLYCQEVHADTLMCSKQPVTLVFKRDTFAVKLSNQVYGYVFTEPYDKERGSRKAKDLWFGDQYEIKFLTRVDKHGMAVFITNSDRMFPSFFLTSENICYDK